MTSTTDPQPEPAILAWRREQAAEAERMRRIFEAATRPTTRDEADEVRVLPGGLRILGRPGGWEGLARRAHQEAAGNAMTGDEQYASPYFDPDSRQAEDRALGTETRVVARADHLGPTVGGALSARRT